MIGERNPAVRAYGVSEIGSVRKTNEDFFVSDEDLQVFVVADGMGGHSSGEVASRLAVETILGFLRRSKEDEELTWPCGVDPKLSFDGNRLRTAILLANQRVFGTAESAHEYAGMGTTVVGAMISGEHLIVGHVGDSRLYIFANDSLTQLTRDDSFVARILGDVAAGVAEDALAQSPMRHMLTSALGTREQTEVHMAEHVLAGGETILLSSDGLHGVLDHESLRRLMARYDDLAALARVLVNAAIERGSKDNVTAVVVRYGA